MSCKCFVCGSRTCKPNSVCWIAPAGRSFLWATHYCEAQATYPEVVTRRAGTFSQAKLSLRTGSLPIWSCSVWGLPCPLHYCNGGALLPHLFTLTSLPRRYVLCGTSRQPGLNPASRTLSGTLLCGVRTFLPRRRSAESDRPVQLPTTPLYAMCRRNLSPRDGLDTKRASKLKAGFARPGLVDCCRY
jgi:hypothetical protein